MKVVSFGEIMVRLGAPDYLKLIQANKFDVSYAGAEANVAVSLANYGVETDFVTCLPDNALWICEGIRLEWIIYSVQASV